MLPLQLVRFMRWDVQSILNLRLLVYLIWCVTRVKECESTLNTTSLGNSRL